jgi:D-alanine-D-alanine ligase-like ATP-grasp enzyme
VDPGAFSQKVVDMVLNGVAAVGRREFAGVDLMFDMHTGQPYVLEVNKTPQIEIGSSAEEKMGALLSYLDRLSRKENA